MSKENTSRKRTKSIGGRKGERYMQPSILMTLKQGPTYGYELIQNISRFAFIRGNAPPGMVYRHLREMEESGLVVSEWKTDEGGPAKRIYRLTPDGEEVLGYWIDYMEQLARKMLAFVEMYREQVSGRRS
ncbi:helix-turn-helix transcriptional regulator [Desulfatitalea alkaliphila]|uniref:Helix-turn-helix transcriptional regulator n=1 Tax=Desulfatitalea alkaliphila TaxID=2929485 RepID=A0AA41R227_9BACT|nr:helix-turn-helix transcriptional regulator [Desulfatitalea alkaliphila]MCJ8499415.1 helix-turn-helix transcriptional regulator [Desulfatitalea alkaliphila]